MSDHVNEAMAYEALYAVYKDDGKASGMFRRLSGLCDVSEPFPSYIERFEEVTEVPAGLLLEAWRKVRDSFEAERISYVILGEESPLFPQLRGDHFPFVYAAGDMDCLSVPSVAILGSLLPSIKGRSDTLDAVTVLVENDVAVAAPLEKGIAASALSYAMKLGGKAIGVMASPLSKCISPDLVELQAQLYEKGVLLSPFAPSRRTERWFQMVRNRYIASAFRAVFIPEEKDGGAAWSIAGNAIGNGARLMISESLCQNPNLRFPGKAVSDGAAVFVRREDIMRIARRRECNAGPDLFS